MSTGKGKKYEARRRGQSGAQERAARGGGRWKAKLVERSPSPLPSGFPSPPRVGFPTRDVRFAQRGPRGEGEPSVVIRLVDSLGCIVALGLRGGARSSGFRRRTALGGTLRLVAG